MPQDISKEVMWLTKNHTFDELLDLLEVAVRHSHYCPCDCQCFTRYEMRFGIDDAKDALRLNRLLEK